VLGMLYIGFRVTLTAWLTAMVLRVTRVVPDPMPLVLLSFVAVVISHGQVTGQGTINVYAWLFAGVLIAACNTARNTDNNTARHTAGVTTRRIAAAPSRAPGAARPERQKRSLA
jgi:hypothetical protein